MNFGHDRLPERFWDKVIPEPMSGCWLWVGSSNGQYGYVRWPTGGKASPRLGVHVVALLAIGIEIPTGMTVDHRCEVHLCVNPHHLDVVTSEENTRRYNARHPVEFCPRGHAKSGDNLYVSPQGEKHCRVCGRLHAKAHYHRSLDVGDKRNVSTTR